MLVAIAPASATTIQQQLNVDLSTNCPPGINCFADPGDGGQLMTGNADFSSIAPDWHFSFMSGLPIGFCSPCPDGNFYEASFGQGGLFTMTGPAGLGLTFSGVVTSGSSQDIGFGGVETEVIATFYGQWSNGLSASGTAFVFDFIGFGPAFPPPPQLPPSSASLSTSVVPEPGSLVLLSSGIVALAARVAQSLKRKLKS